MANIFHLLAKVAELPESFRGLVSGNIAGLSGLSQSRALGDVDALPAKRLCTSLRMFHLLLNRAAILGSWPSIVLRGPSGSLKFLLFTFFDHFLNLKLKYRP